MLIFLLCVAAAAAALAGGFLALTNRQNLNLTLGFTAGIILGLVAFDLLPEIASLSSENNLDITLPMLAFVGGFLLFHIAEKLILMHNAHENDYGAHQHRHVGMIGAGALVGHSFLDGASIGIGFQVSNSVGFAVAIAVIGHRFADGFNTTNVMLFHRNKLSNAKKMLVLASIMPILGGLSTLLFDLSADVLAVYLGFFAGFLLYLAAGDILPQAHSRKSSYMTILLTVLGAAVMFGVTRIG